MPVILPNETDIYALTDSRLSLGRSLEEMLSLILSSDIRIIQYREKHKKTGEMLEECRLMRRICDQYNACFIVNDHLELALLANADGLHLGQEDLPIKEARSLLKPNMCLGISTHSEEQAMQAAKDGADYIGVGPVFFTQTKEDVVPPVGLPLVSWVSQNLDIPFVAIGGIKEHNIAEVVKHGAKCCALVSAIVSANNVAETVNNLRKQIKLAIN